MDEGEFDTTRIMNCSCSDYVSSQRKNVWDYRLQGVCVSLEGTVESMELKPNLISAFTKKIPHGTEAVVNFTIERTPAITSRGSYKHYSDHAMGTALIPLPANKGGERDG